MNRPDGPSEPAAGITLLAERWSAGDESAFDELIELVYDDLRIIAHRLLRLERPGQTIDTTSLVHEAYLRLAGHEQGVWPTRRHFFAFVSRAMRHILIDYARRRTAAKRGGTQLRVTLDENTAAVEAESAEILALDEVLGQLALRDARMARVVECRFFGGLSMQETAETLDASVRTVERDWTRARAWLRRALTHDGPGGEHAPDDPSLPVANG